MCLSEIPTVYHHIFPIEIAKIGSLPMFRHTCMFRLDDVTMLESLC